MSIKMNIVGIGFTSSLLKNASRATKEKADKGIRKAAFFIENEVKQSISGHRAEHRSVDTGNFLNSILPIFPKKLSANIGSNKYPVKYANSLEFNSNIRGGPRRHFGNTKIRNENNVKKIIEEEIKSKL